MKADPSAGALAKADLLVDLPLRPGEGSASPIPAEELAASGVQSGVAPLAARGAAFAADAALVLLLVAGTLLVATAGSGQALRLRGFWWTGVFSLYLSFFATVLPLILFGKTVGMALTGLTARGRKGGPPLTAGESARRWLGTVLTLVSLGIPLLLTRRDRDSPSLGDRLSKRPLSLDS